MHLARIVYDIVKTGDSPRAADAKRLLNGYSIPEFKRMTRTVKEIIFILDALDIDWQYADEEKRCTILCEIVSDYEDLDRSLGGLFQ